MTDSAMRTTSGLQCLTRAAAVAVGLAVFSFGLSPGAQTLNTPTVEVASAGEIEGRAAFDRGMISLVARRYSEAVAALRDALRLRPSPLTIYNLGLALRGTGDYIESVELFDRYLAAPEPNAPPDRLTAIRGEVAVLRRSIASIDISLDPASADLRLDGRSVRREGTVLRVDPGAHVLDVLSEGFVPDHRDVNLAPGAQMVLAVSLRRVASSGRLLIEPSVTTAVITVDGRRVGVGRIDEAYAEGTHIVEIAAQGHQPFRRTVRVGSTGVTRVDAALATSARDLPRWVLPTAVVGGAVLLAGSIVLGVALSSGSPTGTTAGNIWERVNAP